MFAAIERFSAYVGMKVITPVYIARKYHYRLSTFDCRDSLHVLYSQFIEKLTII